MSIWLSAISLTKAGSVAQAFPTTAGLTSYAGTTTARHQLTCGEDPPHVVIREWRYGPRRLRVDDDDDDVRRKQYDRLSQQQLSFLSFWLSYRMRPRHLLGSIFTQLYSSIDIKQIQEAQLPQRDSASATYVFLGSLTDRALHWAPHLFYNSI